MNVLLSIYIEDLRDNLVTFNTALMTLEKNNADKETINSLFRVAHTIKGNSAAINFFDVEKVMHNMEDILHEIRIGERQLSQSITLVLYKCHDFLEDFLGRLEADEENLVLDIETLLSEIIEIKNNGKKNEVTQKTSSVKPPETDNFLNNVPKEIWNILNENLKRGFSAYYINIEMEPDTQMKDMRIWMVFHTVKNHGLLLYSFPESYDESETESYISVEGNQIQIIVMCENNINDLQQALNDLIDIKRIESMPFEAEHILWFLENCSLTENIEKVDETDNTYTTEELHTEMGIVKHESDNASKEQERERAEPDQTNQTVNSVDKSKAAIQTHIDGGMIRVPVLKVDNLLDMLGELMIINSQLTQQIEDSLDSNTDVLNNLARFAKLIRNIQDLSMSLRLIEIKNILHRLSRIARETAHELNKQVSLTITGEDTEIDRSAAEKIFDPLMHLVRNAVSHGIETPEERIAKGKSPDGNVEIRAYSKRGSVYVEVIDDGKGIDPEKILAKAIKLGIANESESYAYEDIIKFILKPGFSTQEQVNNISGRGVGLNVVEDELKKLGGKVEIDNHIGKGCSFIVRIPINLALINGTIVRISGERYIIPTLFIREYFILKDELISIQGKKRAIRLRDRVIPLITENLVFGKGNIDPSDKKEILILEMENKLLAFPVDRILGRQDLVSKPLDNEIASSEIVSGASILGDGRVSLILDVEMLFKLAGM